MRFEIGKDAKTAERPVRVWLQTAIGGGVELVAEQNDIQQIVLELLPQGALRRFTLSNSAAPSMGFSLDKYQRIRDVDPEG